MVEFGVINDRIHAVDERTTYQKLKTSIEYIESYFKSLIERVTIERDIVGAVRYRLGVTVLILTLIYALTAIFLPPNIWIFTIIFFGFNICYLYIYYILYRDSIYGA